MGLEAIHRGSTANPAATRGLRMAAGIEESFGCCQDVTQVAASERPVPTSHRGDGWQGEMVRARFTLHRHPKKGPALVAHRPTSARNTGSSRSESKSVSCLARSRRLGLRSKASRQLPPRSDPDDDREFPPIRAVLARCLPSAYLKRESGLFLKECSNPVCASPAAWTHGIGVNRVSTVATLRAPGR